MKRFSEQLKKKSDSIRLRATERADLRGRLESYMEYHPLPADMKQSKTKNYKQKNTNTIASEPFTSFTVNMTYIRSLVGVFALILVVGIPIIAEKSVPGDVLYPVKRNITEELRSTLTLSPYAKVQWETKRLERRVAEAQLLASQGKLTPEVEQSVAQAIKDHTDAAVSEIATLRESDADKAELAEIAFASALSVQADVLTDADDTPSDTFLSEEGHSVAALATVLADARDDAHVDQAGGDLSYEKLLASVEEETTSAYELFESIHTVATAEETEDIKRRLEDIERKIMKAKELHVSQESVSVPPAPETLPKEDAVISVPVVGDVPTEVSLADIPTAEEEGQSSSTVLHDVDPPGVPEEVEVMLPSTQKAPEQQLNQEEDALALLRSALTDTQKLIIFMTDLHVRQNVSIETLVPITPTYEEQKRKIDNTLQQLLEIQKEIETQIQPDISDEKTIRGSVLLSTQIQEVQQLISRGNISGAETKISQAQALAEDLLHMIAQQPVQEGGENPSQTIVEQEETKAEEGVTEEENSTILIPPPLPEIVPAPTEPITTETSG